VILRGHVLRLERREVDARRLYEIVEAFQLGRDEGLAVGLGLLHM
jgi:hypothetical protein